MELYVVSAYLYGIYELVALFEKELKIILSSHLCACVSRRYNVSAN
jgi:hypothetical protein